MFREDSIRAARFYIVDERNEGKLILTCKPFFEPPTPFLFVSLVSPCVNEGS